MAKTKNTTVEEVLDVEGVKTLEQKTKEIQEQATDLGMRDPSTEAKIQAMETATERTDRADLIAKNFTARDEARGVKADELETVKVGQKAMNESLSDKMQVEQAKDEKQTVDERAKEVGEKPTNLND